MKQRRDFKNTITRRFERHPEREFYLTEIPVDDLPSISSAGWVAGAATHSASSGSAFQPYVQQGCKTVPCIVRRADAYEGRNLPGVYLLDGPPSVLPEGTARAEEQFCERLWAMAQAADHAGVSLDAYMSAGVVKY